MSSRLVIYLFIVTILLTVGCAKNQPRVVWKIAGQSDYLSAPFIAKGVAYINASDLPRRPRSLYAIDLETRKTKWRVENDISLLSFTEYNGILYGLGVPPFTGSGVVLFAIKARTARRLWQTDIDDDTHSIRGIRDGRIYLNTEGGELLAFDIETGRQVLKVRLWPGSGYHKTFPGTIADGLFYYSGEKEIRAIDIKRRNEVWRFELPDKADSPPSIVDGVLYIQTYNRLYAIDIEKKTVKWESEYYTVQHPTGERILVSIGAFPLSYTFKNPTSFAPVVKGDMIYLSDLYEFYAADRETGEGRWFFKAKGEVLASPVVIGGVVYFGTDKGNVYALDAQTGRPVWHRETEISQSPAVDKDTVCFGASNKKTGSYRLECMSPSL